MKNINYLELFPFISQSVKLFDDQNRFLKKIILTGKISALEKAANLFSFTEKTIETFSELKEELIPLLIHENLKKHTEELRSKAQISIDILIRNLFERTADVGFLATDNVIIDFLNGIESSERLQKRLIEYTMKYSVYNEILITDVNGNVKLNIDSSNPIHFTTDPIIKNAIKANGYVEQYAKSDLFSTQTKTLMFAQKIVDKNSTIGVLVMCFRFEDEMKRIFKSLLNSTEHIYFTDGKEIIVSSSSESKELKIRRNEFNGESDYSYRDGKIFVSSKTKGYEGYFGAPWNSISFIDIRKCTKKPPVADAVSEKCTLDENIKAIIRKADDVIEDLSDVIINGELIASKERVYVLTPVLDNLRTVSSAILGTIKETVTNLENTIMEGLIYDVQTSAKLAIDIMDRNLYERANDCRWWAITPIFEEELESNNPDIKRITDVLQYINGLYTVYTNLFIYDSHANIIASSSNPSIVGRKISGEFITKTLNNHNSQNYFVSNFEQSAFYNDEATYIYNATITSNGRTIGGIGIVFDATPQFKAILQDSFPASKKGFACFVDRKGLIIATTNPSLQSMDHIELDDEISRFNSENAIHRFLDFQGKRYLVGIALSRGYREYKSQDNYKNDILSLTFIEY